MVLGCGLQLVAPTQKHEVALLDTMVKAHSPVLNVLNSSNGQNTYLGVPCSMVMCADMSWDFTELLYNDLSTVCVSGWLSI